MRGTVSGTLRHEGGVRGVTWHFGKPGWTVREVSPTETEAANDWCDVLLGADGDDVLLLGTVERERFDDLVALLSATRAATVAVTLSDGDGNVLRVASVTPETRAADEAAMRERYERDLATLTGLRVLDVTYWDIAYDPPIEPDWDRGDWHHAVMGVELTTGEGAVFVTWTNTFWTYGVEAVRDPRYLSGEGTRWHAGDHALWRARRGPVLGVATSWDRVETGPSRTSDGTRPTPAVTYTVPFAIRLDFDAGPVWFVSGLPAEDEAGQPFLGGDEIMVVFGAERMRRIGFDDEAFLAAKA